MTQQLTPQEAYTWATKIMPNCQNDELEQIIMTDPFYAYCYASCVIKGRWIEAEPIIATNPHWAYNYAYYVIKGRFERGEAAIVTVPYYAYWYAYDVVKGRFELGEPAIKKSAYQWDDYCKHFGIKQS
jgi:hypothetical protein